MYMGDSIDKTRPADALDSALNPTSPQGEPFDVLARQELQKEPEFPSGLHDLAEIPLNQRPTNLPPIPDVPPTPPSAKAERIETKEEVFKTDPRILAFFTRLISSESDFVTARSLRHYLWELGYVNSKEEIIRVLDDARSIGNLSPEQYAVIQGYLDEPEPDRESQAEIVEDDAGIVSPSSAGFKPIEDVIAGEHFVVPQDLIIYIKSLMKHDIGPALLLEELEKENLSREQVRITLSDGFHHLKILTEEEYRKALEILGEPEEDVTKDIEDVPVPHIGAEARTLDSDVGVLEEALKTEEKVAEPENAPVVFVPESIEQVDVELAQARSEYATQYVAWKNKIREKKRWYSKFISDLGIEKQMPESERPPELKEAEAAYILAKKNKASLILNPQNDPSLTATNSDELMKERFTENGFNYDLFEQTERERDALQKQILDSIPQLERGRVAKLMEIWVKQKWYVRIPITTLLMTGAGMAFGTVAVAGAGATLAYRGVRSGVGAVLGQQAGAIAGQELGRKSYKRVQEAREKYSGEMRVDLSNFEEREKELMRFYEKEENQIKRNRLKKAGIIMGAGAGVNLGLEI